MKAFNLLLRLASAYGMTFRCATGTALFAVATSPVSIEAGIRHSPRNRWDIEHTVTFFCFCSKKESLVDVFSQWHGPGLDSMGSRGTQMSVQKAASFPAPVSGILS